MEFPQEKIELLKNTVCKGSSNDEFQLFLHVCRKTGLDPFMRQIYSIPRGSQRTIQTGIDGLRLIAERTTRYSPGKETLFVYDANGKIISATSYVKKQTLDGTWHEVSATAFFEEFNAGTNFWKKMPNNQLAKCAEALALRKAFPAEMSGIYAQEEMDQADNATIQEVSIEDEDETIEMRSEEIEAYLETWNKQKENFRIFLLEMMEKKKWNARKTIKAFKKNPGYTKGSFAEWLLARNVEPIA